MPIQKFVDVRVGDVVRLRRGHPCGGTDWTVVRLGADIGMVCTTCQRRIMLPRSDFERRLKQFLSQVPRGVDLSAGTGVASTVAPRDESAGTGAASAMRGDTAGAGGMESTAAPD